MLVFHYQNADLNQGIKTANRSFENVSQFKYLGTTVTNQKLIQEEIRRRLNSSNSCYHSVQNHFSSCLLTRNLLFAKYNWTCEVEEDEMGEACSTNGELEEHV
jgi:hypothetical protein